MALKLKHNGRSGSRSRRTITSKQTSSFVLRRVDAELWGRFRARAHGEGRVLRWVILTLINHYTRHGLPEGAEVYDATLALDMLGDGEGLDDEDTEEAPA